MFVSGRRTHLEKLGRLKQDEMNAAKKLEKYRQQIFVCFFLSLKLPIMTVRNRASLLNDSL